MYPHSSAQHIAVFTIVEFALFPASGHRTQQKNALWNPKSGSCAAPSVTLY